MVCPPTFTSGFGIASLSGRMRLPSPAASTIAQATPELGASVMRVFTPVEGLGRRGKPRDVRLVPPLEAGERRMGEVAGEIRFDPGHVGEVLRLAVALVQAREDAEDLR